MKKLIILIFLLPSIVGCAQSPKVESAKVEETQPRMEEERPMVESAPVIEYENIFERDMKKYPSVHAINSKYNSIIKDCKNYDYSGNYMLIEQGQGMFATCKTFYEFIERDLKSMSEKEALEKTLYKGNHIKHIQMSINNTAPRDLNKLIEILDKYDLSKYIAVIDDKVSFDSTPRFENFKEFQSFIYYTFGWNRYSLVPDLNNNLVGYLKANKLIIGGN